MWRSILADDDNKRISIWYYNLDPKNASSYYLDEMLKRTSSSYAESKTPFLDAVLFEPREFLYYIESDQMSVSDERFVDCIILEKSQLLDWLMSYSFCPKSEAEKNLVMPALYAWFEQHKNGDEKIRLDYIGFISQGPLRRTVYHQEKELDVNLPASPISSLDCRFQQNLTSKL
jgi:hypothetical protein